MNTIQNFAELNKYAHVYQFDVEYKENLNFDIQREYKKEAVKNDFSILQNSILEMNKETDFRLGDFVLLPDGQFVRFTHIWEDSIQTYTDGSFYLSKSGYLSYSGSLDSGIKKEDLILTNDKKLGQVWFFSQGEAGGNRGVYANIEFRVYKVKKGADLSGVPQVARLKKQKHIEKSETITRINGNGQPYTMHLPEIIILKPHKEYKDKFIKGEFLTLAGLKFKISHWGNAHFQPMKITQINKLVKMYSFKGEFHNNATSKNILYLEETPNDDFKRYTNFK